jgi:DNA-binding NtrC family response regulator
MSNDKPLANILVVDDESDIVKVVVKGLQKNGFNATGFTDPSSGLRHLRQHSKEYCAVLSDIRMPGLSGFQMAREIKNINPELKIVLMSAFEIKAADFEKVMPSTSVDDFIEKPATIVTISNVLLKHISRTKSLK